MKEKQVRIGILQAFNTLNYGSMMLCENAIHYVSEHLPQAHFVVLSDFVEETGGRLKEATRRENIEVRYHLSSLRSQGVRWSRLPWFADQLFFRHRRLIRDLRGCKGVIVLGGDDISETYSVTRLLDVLIRLACLKRAGKKIYLLGQSIGAMRSWRRPLAGGVLRAMDRIYHRGPESYDLASRELGAACNAFSGADLAFLDLARQGDGFDLARLNLKKRGYVALVPSSPWKGRGKAQESTFRGLMVIARYLLKKCEEQDRVLALLPHVLRWPDDRVLVGRMAAGLGGPRVRAINQVLLPYQARAILGSAHFVVSQRMHATLSSLQAGVPALSIASGPKFMDVVGNSLGLGRLVIEQGGAPLDRIAGKVCAGASWALRNMADLEEGVRRAVSRSKRQARCQIAQTARAIEALQEEGAP